MALPYLLTRWLVVIAFPIGLYVLVQRLRYPKRRVTLTGVLIAAGIGLLLVQNNARP